MPRRIANGLTLLSAVVCLGSATLVGRSVFYADSIVVPIGERAVGGISSVDGQLSLIRAIARSRGPFNFSSIPWTAARRAEHADLWTRIRGVYWLRVGWGRLMPGMNIVILPLWLLPLLTAIGPVRWWRKRRREAGRGFAVAGA